MLPESAYVGNNPGIADDKLAHTDRDMEKAA